MAVEDAQAPGGHDQHPRPREQNPRDRDRELAFRAGEPRRNHRDEHRRGEHAHQHDDTDQAGHQRANRARDAIGLGPLAARHERRVHRNE
jgi:hypothetical protein